MHRSRLVTGIAAALGGMTAVLALVGVAYNPAVLLVAAVFAAATYLVWYHASGRLAARVYRGVERQGARNAGPDRGGFGAGPRQAWTGPRRGRAAERGRRPQEGTDRPPAEAYRVLGLEPGADASSVRRAYRERAKEVHPDADGGSEEAFKRVTEAYERLREETGSARSR